MNSQIIKILESHSSPSAALARPPEERGLAGFTAQELFPGRTSLRIRDVAKALGIVRQHVVDLIEEFRDTDGQSGLAAINVASGLHSQVCPDGSKGRRCQWRIPVAAFDAFIRARTNCESATGGRGSEPESQEPGSQCSAVSAPASVRRRGPGTNNRK